MNFLYLPKDCYVAEDIDARGRHILQFAVPRLEETEDVSFIDVPKGSCSLTLDRSYKVEVGDDVRLYPGDLLDIHFKDQYESCDLPFETASRETRSFSVSKFRSAFRAVTRQARDTEELYVSKDAITASGDDFCTATASFKGQTYDFVISSLDCVKNKDGSLCFTVARDTPMNGLAIKDLRRIFPPVKDLEK